MIRDTSVIIVILSPNMKLSQWVNWELEYSLREISTYDRTSHTNGVVAVVQKQETYGFFDGYAWMKNSFGRWDYNTILPIIRANQDNKKTAFQIIFRTIILILLRVVHILMKMALPQQLISVVSLLVLSQT